MCLQSRELHHVFVFDANPDTEGEQMNCFSPRVFSVLFKRRCFERKR